MKQKLRKTIERMAWDVAEEMVPDDEEMDFFDVGILKGDAASRKAALVESKKITAYTIPAVTLGYWARSPGHGAETRCRPKWTR